MSVSIDEVSGLRYGQATDAGAKPRNEDSLGIRVPEGGLSSEKGVSIVIADGVSVAEAAREAADLCVLGMLNDYYSTPDTWQVKTSAHRVLTALNRWLYSEGQGFRDEGKGFVCAMSTLIIKGRRGHIFHVGDTRVWHFRDGRLEQVTRDHVQQVSNKITYLSRAMGLGLNLRIDYQVVEVQEGDIFLLTTDGVHDCVRQEALTSQLKESSNEVDFDAACESILELARQADSPDNLSCQMLSVQSLPRGGKADLFREQKQLAFPPDLEPGMKLEGWKVERLIDASPRSQVYLVTDQDSGAKAVMKTPSVNFQDDAGYVERFIMEEWIGKRVNSPHVVRSLDKKVSPKFLYFIMEYIEGKPLEQWMAENRRPDIAPVVEIVQQLVRGLRALHRKETIHQDLKPSNIILQPDGTAKIIDLGSVHIAGARESDRIIEKMRPLGTARYSAPEDRLGASPNPKSDQFSLAAITYEMLTGEHPYGNKYELATSAAQLARLNYTPSLKYNPLVPGWIDEALRKALRIDPIRRYNTLSEFIGDLEKPNPTFIQKASELPLIERNPLVFWKLLAALLAAALAVTLCLLITK